MLDRDLNDGQLKAINVDEANKELDVVIPLRERLKLSRTLKAQVSR